MKSINVEREFFLWRVEIFKIVSSTFIREMRVTNKSHKSSFVCTFRQTAIQSFQWHLNTLLDIVLNIWLNLEKRDYLCEAFICDFRTLDGLSLGSSDKDIKCHHLTFYYSSSPLYYFSALNTTPTSHIRLPMPTQSFSRIEKNIYTYVQVNLCQKLLFLHQLIHNMTTYCLLNYKFNT